jgi:hypothetical protein
MATSASTSARKRGKLTKTKNDIPEPSLSEEELRQLYASNRRSRLIIFGICVLFRLANASITRTYDNPDEYWQAQEVAHRLIFGYPFWTWCKLWTVKASESEMDVHKTLSLTLDFFHWQHIWLLDLGMARTNKKLHSPAHICCFVQTASDIETGKHRLLCKYYCQTMLHE